MSITIKDVARECGMSISTVSKVFNGYPDISEETREQVLRMARRLGYQPNALARALKTNRSYNLGVLFVDESTSGLMHPFFAAMLNAFKAESEARGYDITFINHNIGKSSMTFLEHCRYRNVDGVCLACVDFYSEEVRDLVLSGIPSCTVDYRFENRPCVCSDNVAGMRMLLEHAYSMGHRHIAFIHGQRNSLVTETRIECYKSLMAEMGLSIPEGYLLAGRYEDVDLTEDLMHMLLMRPDRPTCVLLPDDESYFGALESAQAMGLRVPEDISLMGFDGIRLTQSLRVPLTTVYQDSERMGRQAAQRLIERVEHPGSAPADVATVPVRFIPGATVARIGTD